MPVKPQSASENDAQRVDFSRGRTSRHAGARVWWDRSRRQMSRAGRARDRRDLGDGCRCQRSETHQFLEEGIAPWRSQSMSVSVARSANQITARAGRAFSWKSSSTDVQSRTGSGFSRRLKGFSSRLEMRSIANFNGICPPRRNLSQTWMNVPTRSKSQNGRTRAPRPATPNQVRAIQAIAQHRGVDLSQLLAAEFNAKTAEELTIVEASRLIDRLQSFPIPSDADSAGDP